MRKSEDIIGKIFSSNNFGEFEVLGFSHKQSNERYYNIRFIETGSKRIASKNNILKGEIKDNFKPSVNGIGFLGNIKRKDNKELYSIWSHILERCYVENSKNFKWYGYKGVTVCDDWLCFEIFVRDVQEIEGYNKELIEKKQIFLDKDINQLGKEELIYSKDTCKWVSFKENIKYAINNRVENNNRNFIAYSPDGKSYTSNNQSEFARLNNLSKNCINRCLNKRQKQHKGWTFRYENE